MMNIFRGNWAKNVGIRCDSATQSQIFNGIFHQLKLMLNAQAE